MKKTFTILFLWAVAGCAEIPGALTEKPMDYKDPATEVTTVLQFVPGTEGEYGRQEALYVKSGAHYRLQKLINIEGVVQAVDGTPLSGKVRFTGAQPGGTPDPATIRQKEFDVLDGTFIARLVPGDYLVDLIPSRADEFPAQRIPVVIETSTRKLDLVAAKGAKVTGVVKNAEGAGLAGISVRVLSAEGVVGSQSVLTASGPEAGRYAIAVGPDLKKNHRVEFSAPEKFYPRVVFDVSVTSPTAGFNSTSIPEVTLDVVYEPKTDRVVSGKVIVDETDEPAEGVAVVFSASAPQPIVAARRANSNQANLSAEAIFTTQTDNQGNFSLTIPQGEWNYAFSLQAPLDRPYGGHNENIYTFPSAPPVYRLKAKRTVSGRVFGAQSRPVFAEVFISKTFSLIDSQQVLRVFTDASGNFSAALDASVSAYDITVLPLDGVHARCTRTALSVSGFDESFFVYPGEKSTGFVADRDGNPISRVAITLVGRPASMAMPLRVLAESESLTDSNGLFELLVPTDPTLTGCRGAQIGNAPAQAVEASLP